MQVDPLVPNQVLYQAEATLPNTQELAVNHISAALALSALRCTSGQGSDFFLANVRISG
jgi:hypothetical protein